MDLQLNRIYYAKGTNGILYLIKKQTPKGNRIAKGEEQALAICSTIELPWLHNKRSVSCIPEGKYELTLRSSRRFGLHLAINNVPGRSHILTHPFNDALKQSKGCIATVAQCTAPGKGIGSRISLQKLLAFITPEIYKGNKVFIHITSTNQTFLL